MSWYNNENWYAPNYEAENNEPPKAEAPKEKPKAIKSSKKARLITVIAVGLVLIAALLMILFFDLGSDSGDSGPASVTDPDSMPEDWHKYFGYLDEDTPSMEFKLPAFEGEPDVDITLLSGGGAVLSLGEIYDKMLPSVVGIRSYYEKSVKTYGWGTGVIVAEDGYIVTNAHVVENAVRAEVLLYNGSEYEAALVAADSATDLAILKIDAAGLSPAAFASPESVSVGDTAIAIGNPLSENLSYTMTTGIISAPRREVSHNGYTMELIQSDAPINSGNSGGPLLNDRGEVIGISNMKMVTYFSSSVEGIGFAVPSDKVKALVDTAMGRSVSKGPTIGITVAPVLTEVSEYYDIPTGLYVAKVSEGSDAAAQGMKPGDILTAVNGTELHENDDLLKVKEAVGTGGTLRFDVWRDGETLTFDVLIMDAEDFR